MRITAAGQPVQLRDGDTVIAASNVKLEAPRATVETARADLIRRGDTIIVRPRP